jgi:hypothetical protein
MTGRRECELKAVGNDDDGAADGGGRGRGVGADVVVKLDVVVMLLVVAARLTRPWDHPGCLAGILCIENIAVTSLWRRPSESVSR